MVKIDDNLNSVFESVAKIGQSVQQSLNKMTKEASQYVIEHQIGFTPSTLMINPYEKLMRIDIPPNPLIALNEEFLIEIKQLNSSIDIMNKKIIDLENKANETERSNIKRQWIIAIISTLLGAITGSVLTMFITLLLTQN